MAASLTLGIAVGVFGLSFGVLAVAGGLTVAQTCAMSLLVFTGASQFTAVAVVTGGGSPAAALGSALLLAARNGGYGLALARTVPFRRGTRLVAAQLVIDESTAMALAQSQPEDRSRAFWVTGLAVFAFWNLSTFLGALGGSAVGDPRSLGLDAAFPASFVFLLAPHLRRREGRLVALTGAAVALVLVPLAPAGVPVLAAGLAAVVGLRPPRAEVPAR